MQNKFYPLANDTVTDRDKKLVQLLFSKNAKLTMDKKVKNYEKVFARYHNMKYCTMFNSGSSANLVMIASLIYHKKRLLKENDEVIVPVLGWSTSYYPLLQYKLKPVFVDIDKETFNISVKDIEKNISKKTKAILLINVLGNPSNYDEIIKIAKRKKIIVLEDNCESLGAKYKGKLTGTYGLISSCSSYFSHHISTIEGGYMLTNSKYIDAVAKSLRSHGWARDESSKLLITKNDRKINRKFLFLLPGYNLRPTEINAALGMSQIKKLNKFIKIRRDNFIQISKIFSSLNNFILQKENGMSSWFGFGILYTKKNKKKFEFIINTLESKGVETRPIITGDFTKQPVIKYFKYRKSKSLKNIYDLNNYGFMIGNNSEVIKKEIVKKLMFIFRELDKI
tara:strand:+ start:30039 stop:31223 length:1185 start_codon:yes stop_codon:yes gene_type:complete